MRRRRRRSALLPEAYDVDKAECFVSSQAQAFSQGLELHSPTTIVRTVVATIKLPGNTSHKWPSSIVEDNSNHYQDQDTSDYLF